MFGVEFSVHVLTTIVVIISALDPVTSVSPTVPGVANEPKANNPNGPNANSVTNNPTSTNMPSSTQIPGGPNDVCGIPEVQPTRKRIIGGEEAKLKSWPWIVLLSDMGHRICGGTILNVTTVLTAAHCFDGSMLPERWTVFAGKQHLNITDPQQTVHRVESILQHPLYDNSTLKHDIALLVLKEPVIYSAFVRPICLPTTFRRMVPSDTICYTAGWGDTRGTADPYVLNQVGLPLLNDYWCSKEDWYGSQFIPRLTFCAGYSAGRKDDCKGDSGGPYICKVDGKWYQQGIVSWGRDCGRPHWPSVFTDVSKYWKWINDHLNGNERTRQKRHQSVFS